MTRNSATAAALLLLCLASISLAQTRPGASGATSAKPFAPQLPANVAVPATKIALIDTSIFGDETAGIKRYLAASKTVQRDFQPRTAELVSLQNRLKVLGAEITRLRAIPVADPKAIQAKEDEGERLQRDLKYKEEQRDADFGKRFNEVVGPISADIGKALDQYASQHGLTMILDVSKLLPAILTLNPAMDVTQAFIADYNSKNP